MICTLIEETGTKCLPTDLVGYLQILVDSFHLVYYASLLLGCVNVSSCLLSVSQYVKKLYLPIKAILQICKVIFTVHKLCLIIANYSSFTVTCPSINVLVSELTQHTEFVIVCLAERIT